MKKVTWLLGALPLLSATLAPSANEGMNSMMIRKESPCLQNCSEPAGQYTLPDAPENEGRTSPIGVSFSPIVVSGTSATISNLHSPSFIQIKFTDT